MTTPERLQLALERLTYEHGFQFERFAVAFIAGEFPDLRPIGGMHDRGRDAILYSSLDQSDVVVQCSVTTGWEAKIRATVSTLNKQSLPLRELIYCTPHAIQGDADSIKGELRRNNKVSLDIRDRSYFMTHSSHGRAQRAAADELERLIVAPLLVDRGVLARASPSLSAEEEQLAVTYLQLELGHRDPTKNLTKLCVESLVVYCLREASPDALVPQSTVVEHVTRHMRGASPARVRDLVVSALARLCSRGTAKHHTKADAYTLSHPFRQDMENRVATLLQDEGALVAAAQRQLAICSKDLEIPYPYPDSELAADVLVVLDNVFFDLGHLAGVALVGKGLFATPRDSLDRVCRRLLTQRRELLRSTATLSDEQFLDLVPETVERLLAGLDPAVAHRLRVLSDAYCLQFLLQQTPDVQSAIKKILTDVTLLVDTSVVLHAMAEAALPEQHRQLTNLLRASSAMGCRLVAGDDVINELDTHIDRIRHNQRKASLPGALAPQQLGASPLEKAWSRAQREEQFRGTFDEFIQAFKGSETPELDLAEYMKHELGISYSTFKSELEDLSPEYIGELFDEWKEKKPRRPWVDDEAFERLVLHDVRAFALVESQRQATTEDAIYSHRWWWVVLDGTAFRFDRQRHGNARGGAVCMSPDFFARYLSLSSKPASLAGTDRLLPPSALQLASLGLVPANLRSDAQKIYDASSEEKPYLRRRKVRDLINRAIATSEEDDRWVDDDERFPPSLPAPPNKVE